jgi:hypothetical protein
MVRQEELGRPMKAMSPPDTTECQADRSSTVGKTGGRPSIPVTKLFP